MSRDEAAALAQGNPLSFLHVCRAEIDLPADVGPHDPRVYTRARQNLQTFLSDGSFVQEPVPCVYLYELTMEGRSQVGVVGVVHVDDYERGAIRKHEMTRKDKEDDRTRYVLAQNAQVEPVFLTYPGQPFIEQQNRAGMAGQPLYDFTADDGVRHRVWRVADPAPYGDTFRRVNAAYIADGHHRCASAWRAAVERRDATLQRTGEEEYNWFLAVLFPATQVRILPYHRVVRDLNGLTPEAFLARLAEVGAVTPTTAPAPEGPGRFGVLIAGRWYRLTLDPATVKLEDPVRSLDPALLEERVLGPVLGIADIRTDPRIDFVGGIRGTAELERRVGSGEMAVAFALHPVTVADLLRVSDAGRVMPPKSTWFEPKLKSGLFLHTLD